MVLGFRLARAGYGSYHEVMEFDSRTFLKALQYEKFKEEYDVSLLNME